MAVFCRYLTDPAYGWAAECQARFGTHPVQVCLQRNAAVHNYGNSLRQDNARGYPTDLHQPFPATLRNPHIGNDARGAFSSSASNSPRKALARMACEKRFTACEASLTWACRVPGSRQECRYATNDFGLLFEWRDRYDQSPNLFTVDIIYAACGAGGHLDLLTKIWRG